MPGSDEMTKLFIEAIESAYTESADIMKQVPPQVSAAVLASLGTYPLQNAVVRVSLLPKGDAHVGIFQSLQDAEKSDLIGGVKSYVVRQTGVSLVCIIGTTKVSEFLTSIPESLRPIVAGIIVGLIEARLGFKPESEELKKMLGGERLPIKPGVYYQAVIPRNSIGWGLGAAAYKLSKENNLSPEEDAALGFIAGFISGCLSMPFQNILSHAAESHKSFMETACKLAISGKFFHKAPLRGSISAIFTAAGGIATKFSREAKEDNRSVEHTREAHTNFLKDAKKDFEMIFQRRTVASSMPKVGFQAQGDVVPIMPPQQQKPFASLRPSLKVATDMGSGSVVREPNSPKYNPFIN